MCGIVVEQYKKGKQQIHVGTMLKAISHRGKDSVTIDQYENTTVGFNRLAVTDIECRPKMGSWKVYLNGEIYNYKELGFEGCEVEVISQGFEKYGLLFVERLNGMFFIVAVNNDQVYCFRDRYGIKPGYYFENDNVILIASEIKAIIVHPEYSFGINEAAKKQWFVFNNVLTDATLFKGVYKVPKATIWDLQTKRKMKYWEWKFTPHEMDYEGAKAKIKSLAVQAVERQRPKETKYTSCLSGGVDSNIIASLLGDAKTFTVGYEGINDERYQAKLLGTVNETVIFDKVNHFEETIYHLEDLRVGACWSNFGMFKRIAEEPGKVCFDGAGADELFGGYPWRYDMSKEYYDIVNRTGVKDEYCEIIFKHFYPDDKLENRFEFDANHFLEAVLLSVDKMSMAHTLEIRLPFLDNDLVDFCLYLPNEFKVNKKILKEAFKNELPGPIFNGIKRGFSSPDWIEGEGNQALKWATAAYNEWEKKFKK